MQSKVGSRSWASWVERVSFWIDLGMLWREWVTIEEVRVAQVGGRSIGSSSDQA